MATKETSCSPIDWTSLRPICEKIIIRDPKPSGGVENNDDND